MADLKDEFRRILTARMDQDSAHDIAHAERVWANAQTIAEGEGFAVDKCLMAACYLHDLVSLPKNHPDRAKASSYSAKEALVILGPLGFSQQQVAEISHAIESHSFSAGKAAETGLARIVQDADRLEALGAIGLARCLAVSGALGRALFHPTDPFAQGRALDDSQWGIDHFAVKLLKLPAGFQTKTGRKLAESSAEILRQFLRDLAAELGHLPPNW